MTATLRGESSEPPVDRSAELKYDTLICFLSALFLTSAAAHAADAPLGAAAAMQRAALLDTAGRQIFLDEGLSASGRQSCASCHDPARRFNPSNALDVQPGGTDLQSQGFRAPPTLTYLHRIPPYNNHYRESDEEGDESLDNGPTGGLTWDGRVDGGAHHAVIPLTSPFEMANTRAGVAAAARKAPYAATLKRALGEHALDTDAGALDAVVRALAAYEEDLDAFGPYTSKYDAFLTGRAQLTDQEKRGLALFNDERKGNCTQCHRAQRGRDGTAPALSDYGMIALAVPRNPNIVRNRDPDFIDLGMCGPERKDKASQPEYCGLFRTPTLRNVATRDTFFHNGKFHDLRDVIEFYFTRDITPERWYGRDATGKVVPYDDLPAQYQANINRDAPFAGQKPGAKPLLSEGEIDDMIAFLKTLTDGYLKDNPYRTERAQRNAQTSAPTRGKAPE
jgi:cytochrome c peroxidase